MAALQIKMIPLGSLWKHGSAVLTDWYTPNSRTTNLILWCPASASWYFKEINICFKIWFHRSIWKIWMNIYGSPQNVHISVASSCSPTNQNYCTENDVKYEGGVPILGNTKKLIHYFIILSPQSQSEKVKRSIWLFHQKNLKFKHKSNNTLVSEFDEFKPRLKSPKNRFWLTAGIHLEKFNTNLSETNHIWDAA